MESLKISFLAGITRSRSLESNQRYLVQQRKKESYPGSSIKPFRQIIKPRKIRRNQFTLQLNEKSDQDSNFGPIQRQVGPKLKKTRPYYMFRNLWIITRCLARSGELLASINKIWIPWKYQKGLLLNELASVTLISGQLRTLKIWTTKGQGSMLRLV